MNNEPQSIYYRLNVLITPYRQYYSFGLAKPFWDQLKDHIENGSIAILDMVKNELLKGDDSDQLKIWLQSIQIKNLIKHSDFKY